MAIAQRKRMAPVMDISLLTVLIVLGIIALIIWILRALR